jgi:hypothetical protein
MGLLAWFSTTARKSEAAAHIQLYFEISQRVGVFTGTPAEAANRITELACNRAPGLAKKWKGLVLAASVLAIAVMEDDLPMEARDHCAMALASMVNAAKDQRHLHSYEERDMLRLAYEVYAEFRRLVPVVPYRAPVPDVVPPKAVTPSSRPKVETSRDRERAMEELIKRMQPNGR